MMTSAIVVIGVLREWCEGPAPVHWPFVMRRLLWLRNRDLVIALRALLAFRRRVRVPQIPCAGRVSVCMPRVVRRPVGHDGHAVRGRPVCGIATLAVAQVVGISRIVLARKAARS